LLRAWIDVHLAAVGSPIVTRFIIQLAGRRHA